MGCLGNILWFLFGGAISGLSWCLTGCLWCITIVGIPVGVQCFKLASLSFFPFGKEVIYGGGAGSLILNIIWPAAGAGTSCNRDCFMCHHNRDPVWDAAV